jgi:hypothetical protein
LKSTKGANAMSEQTETNNEDIAQIKQRQEPPLTRRQFCAAENISLSTYAKLKRLGQGPKETHFRGMTLVRITPEARRQWHEDNAKWNKSKAAELEEARRIAIASAAGKKAAESERHVSKRKRAAAAARRRVKA